MMRSLAKCCALAVALLTLSVVPGAAQDWKAEWAATVAAAEKEGELFVAQSANPVLRRTVDRLWPAAYPKIKMTGAIASGAFPSRLVEERRIGKYLYDVYMAGSSPGMYAVAQEALDPLPPAFILPDVKDPKTWGGWDNAFADRNNNRLLAFATFGGTPWYDAAHVSPQEVAKDGLKAMLNPKYKGRIAWNDPSSGGGAGATFAHLIYKVHGWDTLKKIIVDQDSVFYPGAQAPAEAIVRGKQWISIGSNLNNRLGQFKEAGLKLDVRPFGNTPETAALSYGGTTLGIMNKPVHPNAAKVFVNWFLTKEVQQEVLTALQHNARRRDMPRITEPWVATDPNKKYFELQHEDYSKEREALIERIKGLRP
jgi:iron(III) transport system substrate-binding protein